MTRVPTPRPSRTATSLLTVLALVVLAGCQAVTVIHVNEARVAAGRPELPSSDTLTTSARAHSAAMCAAGQVTPSADPAEAHDRETWAEVTELVGRAPLDPSIADGADRNIAATDAIWETWAGDPTLVDPRWDAVGVGEASCGDGYLYQTLVLGDEPAMPASGRYSTIQHPATSLTTTTGLQYGTALDWQGTPVPLLLDLYVPPGATTDPRPTVVYAHGGGFTTGSRSDAAGGAQNMARRGYVVASIDYRLDPRLADEPSEAVYFQAVANAIDDAMESVRWLKANASTYGIDTTRMAFMGSSAGGGIALGIGTADDPTPGGPLAAWSPKVEAVVSTGASLTAGMDAGLVTFEPSDAPVLMFHYELDRRTGNDAAYAMRTCEGLRDGGTTCDFVLQAGTGHTVGLFSNGPFWTSDVGPYLWRHLRLA